MDSKSIKKKLKEFFKDQNDYIPSDNEDLFENNVIDSYGIVEFLSYIDEIFNIEINIEDITEENFATVEKICGLIQNN